MTFPSEAERQRAREVLARLVAAWNNHDRGPIAIADIFREAEALLAAPECTCDMGEGPPMPRCVVHTPTAPSAIEAALDALLDWYDPIDDEILSKMERQAIASARARVLALARPPLSRAEAEGMVEAHCHAIREHGVHFTEETRMARDAAHAALLAALCGGNDG